MSFVFELLLNLPWELSLCRAIESAPVVFLILEVALHHGAKATGVGVGTHTQRYILAPNVGLVRLVEIGIWDIGKLGQMLVIIWDIMKNW